MFAGFVDLWLLLRCFDLFVRAWFRCFGCLLYLCFGVYGSSAFAGYFV